MTELSNNLNSANSNTNTYEYAAFISYRHLPKDSEVAKRVQKAIETYRLPKGVKALENSGASSSSASPQTNASKDRTLGKCFRDEDELSASHSLPEHIKKALAQSRKLIVICTPDTDGSIWVQREISEFIALHGKENVIPVLASGSSSKSIPEILKTQETIVIGDAAVETQANPLAADLRSEDKKKQKSEMLRVIAAVAGCDYDDLKQRQKKRKQRKSFVIICLVIILIAIISALIVWGASPKPEQLISESNELAAESQKQLANGDRIGAISTALKGLPDSESDSSRPVTNEAKTALKQALQIDPDETNIWRPSFILQTPGNIVNFTSSTTGSWVAILDDTGIISVFDLKTGSQICQIELFEFGYVQSDVENVVSESKNKNADSSKNHTYTYSSVAEYLRDNWMLLAAGSENLIIANKTGDGKLACIDVFDHETKWSHDNVTASSVALSEDETEMAIFSIFPSDFIIVGLLDVESGDSLDYEELQDPGFSELSNFLPGYLDAKEEYAIFGIGKYVCSVDFRKNNIWFSQCDENLIHSLSEYKNNIVLATSHRDKPNAYQANCTVYGINAKNTWIKNQIYELESLKNETDIELLFGYPEIVGFGKIDKPYVAVTAGSFLDIYRVRDGKSLQTKNYSSTIVGAHLEQYNDKNIEIYIATADGSLDIFSLDYSELASDIFKTKLPCSISDATIQWYEYRDLLALCKKLDKSNELLVYRYDNRLADEAHEVTLDNMIEEAKEILALNSGSDGDYTLINKPEERWNNQI